MKLNLNSYLQKLLGVPGLMIYYYSIKQMPRFCLRLFVRLLFHFQLLFLLFFSRLRFFALHSVRTMSSLSGFLHPAFP
jgi:hypothetical protein